MNPLTSFGRNVVEGAKMVNPSMIARGIKDAGGMAYNQIKKDVGSLLTRKKVAAKMKAPQPEKPMRNPGFSGYQKYLNQM